MEETPDASQQNLSNQPQTGEGEKVITVSILKWLTVANLVIVALNGFIGYWGFSSAKSISDFKTEAEKSFQAITKIRETVYYYGVKEIERDVERLVKELPGLEFLDEKSKSLKEGLEQALKRLDSIESDLPENVRTDRKFLAKGIIKFDQRDFDGAIADLNKVQGPIAEKYYILGAAYARKKDMNMARQMFRKVREFTRSPKRDPLAAKADIGEGNTLLYESKLPEAIERYKDATKKDPDSFGAYYNLAAAHSRYKKYEEAIKWLCEFKRRAVTDVLHEVETDPDDDFANLKSHLGPQWKNTRAERLKQCG